MDLHAIGGLGDHDLRFHVRVRGEARYARWGRRSSVRRPRRWVCSPSFHTPIDCGMFQLALSVARYFPDATGSRVCLNAFTGRELYRRAA